jgi:hypothetical protein
MTANLLRGQFEFNQLLIEKGLEDLTHAESVHGPAPAGNCINWVLGHILLTRSRLEQLLGGTPLLSGGRWEPYAAGHDDLDRSRALPFDELARITVESLPHLQAVIAGCESRMSEPIGNRGRNIAETIGTFVSHEAYHAGQIHLIRRTLGKPGVFK